MGGDDAFDGQWAEFFPVEFARGSGGSDVLCGEEDLVLYCKAGCWYSPGVRRGFLLVLGRPHLDTKKIQEVLHALGELVYVECLGFLAVTRGAEIKAGVESEISKKRSAFGCGRYLIFGGKLGYG